jgi:prepilin-type N-terminal cleavage/methylation domain-containing protein
MTLRAPQRENRGFSLLEVLVTMSLIVVLMTLGIPCWGMMTRSRSKQAAASLVMESLERARLAAITNKSDVWVIFQHPGGITPDSLRILSSQGGVISPLDRWQPLPAGISFHSGDNLMKEQPPAPLLSSSLDGKTPDIKTRFGSIMFQRAGRVGIPLPGGNPMTLELASTATQPTTAILLSRATGRATCQ